MGTPIQRFRRTAVWVLVVVAALASGGMAATALGAPPTPSTGQPSAIVTAGAAGAPSAAAVEEAYLGCVRQVGSADAAERWAPSCRDRAPALAVAHVAEETCRRSPHASPEAVERWGSACAAGGG